MNSENMKNPNHFTDKEMFEIALKTRNFEIQMFWQRCNYFLWLNTAVGAAFALLIASQRFPEGALDKFFVVLIPSIGAFVSFAWIKVGLGAKYWQSYWEQVLIDFQNNVGFSPSKQVSEAKNIFSRKVDHIDLRVEANLGMPKPRINWEGAPKVAHEFFMSFALFIPFISTYECNVMYKPSVSGWMHRTACFFFLVWVGIFSYVILKYDIFGLNCWLNSFTFDIICNRFYCYCEETQ